MRPHRVAVFKCGLIRRRTSEETLAEIGRSYNVSGWTIVRLAVWPGVGAGCDLCADYLSR